MSNFTKTEKLIFTFATLSLVVFSFFLYDDSLLFPRSNTEQLEKIGSVSFSQNDVRRKNLDTFSWLPASRKDVVFQNDSLFTGERSEATIQLQDGSLIRVQPNSLISLNIKNGQMNLDLRYGNLTGDLKGNSSLVITSGGEEFRLHSESGENSQIQLNKSHSGNVDLKLLAGQIKLVDKKSSKNLGVNAPVSYSKTGNVHDLQKPTLTLQTEVEQKWLRLNPDDPLPFKWDSKGTVSRFEWELSPTEDFSQITSSHFTSTKLLSFRDPVAPGDYFWRLKAYDHNGQVSTISEARKVSIHHLSGPEITGLEQSQFNFEVKENADKTLTKNLDIHWQAHPVLKNFQWQISKTENFEEILHQGQTTSKGFATPALASGEYWVRVNGTTDKNQTPGWSKAVPFSLLLTAKKDERPLAPMLVEKNIRFHYSAEDRNPASVKAPKIEWKSVQPTKSYTLQISPNEQFDQAERYELNSNQTHWSQFKPGKYYYRVYAKGLNNLNSPPSEVGTLEVTVDGIVIHPPKDVSIVAAAPTPQAAKIQWSEIPFAKNYVVQLAPDASFTDPISWEFPSTQGSVQLPAPGKYHVRVQAKDEQDKSITEFSKAEIINYIFRNPLASPTLVEPFDNASIFLQTEMEPFVWLEWRKVDGANSYRIEISDKSDFSRTLIATTIQANRFLIKDKIPLGKIYWRVRAESSADKESSDWAELRNFTLYHQKNETFVK